MTEYEFVAEEPSKGVRIDSFISEVVPEVTRSAVQKLIEGGNVSVNGKIPLKNYKLREGDRVLITIPDPTLPEAVPEST